MRRSATTLLIAAAVAPLVVAPHVSSASKVGDDCTLGGKKLYGRVKIVDAFPDFEVRVVTAFPDLRVKRVDAFADACGRWQMVDAFPDFTIKLVDAFPDLEIEYVDAFPGKP